MCFSCSAGTYNFGYIDEKAYTGDITYVPVDSSQGFWTFTTSGYSVGSSSGGLKGSKYDGIADTGTTLLLLPSEVVKAYYNEVDGAQYDQSQGGYTFSCDAKLPDFVFGLGSDGASVTVPGDYINFAPVTEGGRDCFGGIQEDSGIGFAIYGDVALKAAFVVFDGGKEQLGWAAKEL